MNLASVNLNWLVALDALVEERSVTRAAKRTGVTQGAMSNTLGHLRTLFEDPLFRRTAHGLEPTPRALAVAEPVRQALRLFEASLSPPSFDPATAEHTFVVAASDYVEFVLMPPLMRRLAKEAPRVRIEVRPWGLHEVPASLARAEVDLMIGFYDDVPRGHRHKILFDEEYVCIVRKGHPRVRKKLTLSRYLELEHLLVSQRAGSPGSIDRALAAKGKQRRVAVRVSHFLMVPMLIARTDLIAAISRRVAEPLAGPLGLQMLAPPLSLPRGRIGQVWHDQMESDPGQRWFRALVETVAATL
ncbi:MAG: LysR family transcriptional regulator [Polyangiaceae bacterium]